MSLPYFVGEHSTPRPRTASGGLSVADCWQNLMQECHNPEDREFFAALPADSPHRSLIHKIFSYTPYLTKLCFQYPTFLRQILELGFYDAATEWHQSLPAYTEFTDDKPLMATIRRHKSQGALLIALADIAGEWPLEQVTHELTLLAERSLQLCLNYLWHKMEAGGHIKPTSKPCEGLIVLGMGKLGGYELNYSSDIDLVLLYDHEKVEYTGRQSLQHCLNRFSQDLVRLMQERTAQGYVFRMDLRLRPDPSSTPLVVNLRAAMFYYETVGQNWERAAFIKARPVGGDIAAGEQFLSELRPFLWRRSLDFATIADIQSIKRQMDNRKFDDFSLAGHNLKRGMGGIREIEFIAQIHQLIWGGRVPSLRTRSTCETLTNLANHNLLDPKTVETLIAHYRSLRTIEHRLQMIEDQQTHSLPEDDKERENVALFSDYTSLKKFESQLEPILLEVHDIYRNCFNTEPSLSADGNLSFTGVDLDEGTLETIRKLGFQDAERVAQTIANWHRGNVRAMRTARARELLTELTPTLLRALSDTVDPDNAFQNFSKFLERLPAAVQLFSLFLSNPQVLAEVAVIMGNAPGLAAHLSRHPALLDILLTAQYHNILGTPPQPSEYLQNSDNEEEWIEWLCRFRNEREFLIGTKILMGKLDSLEGNRMLSATADAVLQQLVTSMRERFEKSYGKIAGSGLAIIGLGRLGSHELCFGSDLDLVFLYDVEDDKALSDGDKQFPAVVYFNRLCQRIVGGLEAATNEGRLYAVDTRLRPGGKDSPMAISLSGFEKYFHDSAWNFEKMALLRHRIIYTDPLLAEKLPMAIHQLYTTTNDQEKLKHDVAEMRERIAKEFTPNDPWRVKHSYGGLIDITFIAQYLALAHGHQHPTLIHADNDSILAAAAQICLMTEADYVALLAAWHFQSRLASLLRLCQRDFDENSAPKGLLSFLATSLDVSDASNLKQTLLNHQGHVQNMFNLLIKGN